MKRVCLKDVAEAAGVSAVTASIVLNGGSTRSRARVGAARQVDPPDRGGARLPGKRGGADSEVQGAERHRAAVLRKCAEYPRTRRLHGSEHSVHADLPGARNPLPGRLVRLPAPPGRAAGAADRRAGRRAADRRESERGVGTLPARAVPHALRADRGAGGILGHVRPCSGAA